MISDVIMRTITRQTPEGPEAITFNPQVREESDKLPEWAKSITTTDTQLRTIACDGKNEAGVKCEHTVTFSPVNQEEIAALPDWVRTYRVVNLGNGAKFGYCSDVCEVNGVTTGDHNVPEPKKVQEAGSIDMQRAVAEAKIVESMKAKGSKKIVSTEG